MNDTVSQIEYELKEQMDNYSSIEAIINPEKIQKEISELEAEFSRNPEIWNEPQKAKDMNRQLHDRKKRLSDYNELNESREQLTFSLELFRESPDDSLVPEIQNAFKNFCEILGKSSIKFLLNDQYDIRNAIISIHPGAGGTESCDWASMLYRMYQRYAEQMGFNLRELDFIPGDVAGIKSVTAMIEGEYAFGYLKSEAGVHRLVRISPFDSSARRHTSFVSVDVFPEVEEEVEIEIDPKDLRIDTFCASGPGGQGVNTTYSAVRITHIPTNTIVNCQKERSQIMNRQIAMKVLQSRLLELELRKKQEEASKNQAEKLEIGWGSQIRSYVLQPYQMVKDHRTSFETSATDKVLEGGLEELTLSYLRWSKAREA
jgi:peptide chain release factor 2